MGMVEETVEPLVENRSHLAAQEDRLDGRSVQVAIGIHFPLGISFVAYQPFSDRQSEHLRQHPGVLIG